jgi:toxin-antitoxin system PIN domain toxin
VYLFDVNVWVHAHREDSDKHDTAARLVREILNSGETFAYSPLVLSGFLRVVTHPKVFTIPTDFETAMRFTRSITTHPSGREVLPGPAHWNIFTHLAYSVKPKGNLFPDTYLAALAIEAGCTWVSGDNDYARFPGLSLKII